MAFYGDASAITDAIDAANALVTAAENTADTDDASAVSSAVTGVDDPAADDALATAVNTAIETAATDAAGITDPAADRASVIEAVKDAANTEITKILSGEYLNADGENLVTGDVSDLESFILTAGNQGTDLVECYGTDSGCMAVGDDGTKLITFTEDDSNTNIFISSENSLRTTDSAPRGLSFSAEYDNTVTRNIAFGTANISIDTGDDWSSGETAAITLTDADANTNSLDANDLSVLDESQVIPTIRIGSPFTLGHLGYESLDDGEVKLTDQSLTAAVAVVLDDTDVLEAISADDASSAVSTAITEFNTANEPDTTNIPDIESGDETTINGVSADNADGTDRTADEYRTAIGDLGTMNIDAQVTEVSDILVLTFPDESFDGMDTLQINLGPWDDVGAYLPQNEVSFTGTTMINYNAEDVSADSVSFSIGGTDYTNLANGDSGLEQLTDPSFTTADERFGSLYDENGDIVASEANTYLRIGGITPASGQASVIVDVFTFGLDGLSNDRETFNSIIDRVNNAIYRLELEEDGDNSSDFTGTLEYVGLNQLNTLDTETYEGITAIGVDIVLISDNDSVSVDYNDVDSTGDATLYTATADTPTHSGAVSLDADGYAVASTVTVTVEDADLNTDSGKADVYTTIDSDVIGSNLGAIASLTYADGSSLNELLSVAFDGETWAACTDSDGNTMTGLHDTQFTLQETGDDTGVFSGTFSIPDEYCNNNRITSVTGSDITVEYLDFSDDSGSIIGVSASAGIRSSTGSVSLDRTVYPVPFGTSDITQDEFEDNSGFPLQSTGTIPSGELTVYVSVNDADFNTATNGIDTIDADDVKVEIRRGGSAPAEVTIDDATISETAPDSGIFELELSIAYDDGLASNKCPQDAQSGCILQGDILHVVYTDPSDASGSSNTVTDSATFDLRNGVLQSDQTAYIIGSSAILTLIEPDLNLDSSSTETYPLGLIEWDSSAATCTLDGNSGDCEEGPNPFDPTPSNFLETGPDTGIFQVVIGIPPEIDDENLNRGEEITLTYLDWGPSGSDYVGDKDEEVTTTIYTSNFGATIELDQRVYTWTDKVYITVVAPDHNADSDQVDEIGEEPYPIRVSTRGHEREEYKLVETGADTGIFTGEVILTGFDHDADGSPGSGPNFATSGNGPTDGKIETESESGISVSFKYSEGETVSSSALIRWNVAEIQWLEASYPASGSGIVRVIDPDMNLNPEAVDNFGITVWSDSDGGGIELTVTETNEATGIFEGTVFFGVGVDTSGHRLRVAEGDTVTAQYYDNTLPAPFKETERIRVGATTLIGTIVPPLERAPITDLRAVDSFGSTLDTISVDSQIQLASDITNSQDKGQDFAYLIQIQDENGVTVSLNWITGTLAPGQSLSPAVSWTPADAGTYDVTAFVWESIENPTALSPTATIAITVN